MKISVHRWELNLINTVQGRGQTRVFPPVELDHGEGLDLEFNWSQDDGTILKIPFSYSPEEAVALFSGIEEDDQLEIVEYL